MCDKTSRHAAAARLSFLKMLQSKPIISEKHPDGHYSRLQRCCPAHFFPSEAGNRTRTSKAFASSLCPTCGRRSYSTAATLHVHPLFPPPTPFTLSPTIFLSQCFSTRSYRALPSLIVEDFCARDDKAQLSQVAMSSSANEKEARWPPKKKQRISA